MAPLLTAQPEQTSLQAVARQQRSIWLTRGLLYAVCGVDAQTDPDAVDLWDAAMIGIAATRWEQGEQPSNLWLEDVLRQVCVICWEQEHPYPVDVATIIPRLPVQERTTIYAAIGAVDGETQGLQAARWQMSVADFRTARGNALWRLRRLAVSFGSVCGSNYNQSLMSPQELAHLLALPVDALAHVSRRAHCYQFAIHGFSRISFRALWTAAVETFPDPNPAPQRNALKTR